MRAPALSAIALVLAGCGEGGPVSSEAGRSEGPSAELVAGSDVGTASAEGSAPANVSAPGGRAPLTSGDTAAADLTIPAALHGRWGMTPDDCTSTRGDAKGLLLIDGQQLRFFESTARPARNVKMSADTLSADFAFAGEGMTWTKFETLQVRDGRLTRTESSPMASFTYVRCS
jgi:hypothetical protein